VFENRALRRKFGPRMDEIIGGWGKVHTKKLHNLHPSPDIILIIKSRMMIMWPGHVANVVWKRSAYRVLERNPEGRRPVEIQDIHQG
jgi:hypothetical protein